MLPILALILGLAQLIIFVIVLIKLFNEKGALHGFLGLFCGIYTFIWGWMHSARLGIRNLMLIWTVLLVAGIVVNVLAQPSYTVPALPGDAGAVQAP